MNDLDMEVETEALRKAYAALNGNDITGFTAILDPEIERIEPAGFPTSGTYHGIESVKAQISQGRSTWAEGVCEPESFIVAGDKIVVVANIHVRLKGHTDWIDGRIGDVFTFRNGKAIQFRTFAEPEEAFEWAGVDDRGY
jgi:ketosteroid isomerase-like protein